MQHRDIPTKGGSLRYVASKAKFKKICTSKESDYLYELNQNENLNLEQFNEYIESTKNKIFNITKNKKVVGFGSSAGTTILQYLLNLEDKVSFIVDDNETRHNFFMPGTSLKVFSPDEWYANPGDICINFAWRFGDMIREKHLNNLPNGYEIIDVIN